MKSGLKQFELLIAVLSLLLHVIIGLVDSLYLSCYMPHTGSTFGPFRTYYVVFEVHGQPDCQARGE